MHRRANATMCIPVCLTDGGEMGSLMREHDWASSSFGEPAAWAPSLTTLVGLMLGSPQPTFLAWGLDQRLLYNDRLCPAPRRGTFGGPGQAIPRDPARSLGRRGRGPVRPRRPDGMRIRRRAGLAVPPAHPRRAAGRVEGLYGTCNRAAGGGPLAPRERGERQSFLLDLSDTLRR